MNFNYFKNKKVLITGHTGFKGSWLSLIMKYFGAKVYGISLNIPKQLSHYKTSKINKHVNEYFLDIKNFTRLNKVILKIKPDFVFHLAAKSLVYYAYKNPLDTFNTNAIGTLNILNSINNLSKKKRVCGVIITSDKCYLNSEKKSSYKESDNLGGVEPYSGSKACAEIIFKSFFNTYLKNNKKVAVCTARAGNVIGGGDWSEKRIIPDCIKAWSKNKTLVIRNPNATRPWQHVLDVLHGYILLAYNLHKNKKFNGDSFNFGPPTNSNYKVIDVIKKISAEWPESKWIIKKSSFVESTLLKLNSKKSNKKLKWRNKLKFNEILMYVSNWYRYYYYSKKNTEQMTLNQIKEFFYKNA